MKHIIPNKGLAISISKQLINFAYIELYDKCYFKL